MEEMNNDISNTLDIDNDKATLIVIQKSKWIHKWNWFDTIPVLSIGVIRYILISYNIHVNSLSLH